MAKPTKKPDRDPKEAQALFERTVKNMLSTPPQKHKPLGKRRKDKRR